MPVKSPASDEPLYVAGQWRLMWWRFRKHKLALAGAVVVVGLYGVALGAGFLATGDPHRTDPEFAHLPPQRIHFFDGGRFSPHVYGIAGRRDPASLGIRAESGNRARRPPR